MTTVDVVAEHISVEFLQLNVVAGEAALVVRDVDTTIRGTLHGTKHTRTSRGALETHVKVALEGAGLVVTEGLGEGELTIRLLLTGVLLVETELLQSTAGNEQTSGVGSGPVSETVLDTVAGQLTRRSVGEHAVTLDLSVNDLAGNKAVRETNNEAVLRRVVLVLGLRNEALALVVVGLTLAAATVLDLVAREVRVRLHSLNERLACVSMLFPRQQGIHTILKRPVGGCVTKPGGVSTSFAVGAALQFFERPRPMNKTTNLGNTSRGI